MARRDARHGPHSSFPGRTAVHQGHMHITHYTRSPWHGTPGMARTVPFRGVLRCIRATCTHRSGQPCNRACAAVPHSASHSSKYQDVHYYLQIGSHRYHAGSAILTTVAVFWQP